MTTLKEYKIRMSNKFKGVALSGQPNNTKPTTDIINERDENLKLEKVMLPHVIERSEKFPHIYLEPLNSSIGTVIRGIDMANVSQEEVDYIRSIWLKRKLVFFRNQGHITPAQQLEFASKFGDLGGTHGEWHNEPMLIMTGKKGFEELPTVEGHRGLMKLYANEKFPNAAANWHSDVTWAPKPPIGTLLLARKAAPVGGDTVFCDAYAMYQGLDDKTKAELQNLRAYHKGSPYGHGDISAIHPVLRTHPETGATALFVNPTFTQGIIGMEQDKAVNLLKHLERQMYHPEYQCRFKWQDGSVAMWDNRACQHYASGDFWPHKRLMERCIILGRTDEEKIPFYKPTMNKL